MPGPFPGMDPYLESSEFWRNLHASYIARLSEELNRTLPDSYVARIEERVYVIPWNDYLYPDLALLSRQAKPGNSTTASTVLAIADEPFHLSLLRDDRHKETYVDVATTGQNPRVVLTMELISPANKSRGRGHEEYCSKQDKMLSSHTHLIEIDLLRSGQHTVAPPLAAVQTEAGDFHYIASLHRGGEGPRFDFWPWTIRDRLPRIAVPLDPGVPDIVLDLQTVFDRNYDAGRFAQQIDYSREPEPPFTGEDAEWMDTLLRENALRR